MLLEKGNADYMRVKARYGDAICVDDCGTALWEGEAGGDHWPDDLRRDIVGTCKASKTCMPARLQGERHS